MLLPPRTHTSRAPKSPVSPLIWAINSKLYFVVLLLICASLCSCFLNARSIEYFMWLSFFTQYYVCDESIFFHMWLFIFRAVQCAVVWSYFFLFCASFFSHSCPLLNLLTSWYNFVFPLSYFKSYTLYFCSSRDYSINNKQS